MICEKVCLVVLSNVGGGSGIDNGKDMVCCC